jgi:hypothetical protein
MSLQLSMCVHGVAWRGVAWRGVAWRRDRTSPVEGCRVLVQVGLHEGEDMRREDAVLVRRDVVREVIDLEADLGCGRVVALFASDKRCRLS